MLVDEPALIPNAVEELLRYEAPSPVQSRWVARDVELHGTVIPTRRTITLLNGSADRDERHFADPDTFDVRREIDRHLAFGYGTHFCIGAAVARLEGTVALEETLRRYPTWEIDEARLDMVHTATVRGVLRGPDAGALSRPTPTMPHVTPTTGSIDVTPSPGPLGAEIRGVDLAGDLPDDVVAAIRGPGSTTSSCSSATRTSAPTSSSPSPAASASRSSTRSCGASTATPRSSPSTSCPHETVNFGGIWHSDTTYLARPPMGTMLIAREVPPRGGDTLFASMYAAYDTLSPGMRRRARGLAGREHLGARRRVEDARGPHARPAATAPRSENVDAEHPVVRTHPETGRKALYVNPAHTARFVDMTEDESAPLLQYLFDHAVRPEHTCRFHWEVGSLALWDNRAAMHNPINDYDGSARGCTASPSPATSRAE